MTSEPLDRSEHVRLPTSAPPTNHGHTVAAWVTVSLVVVGAVVASAGVLSGHMALFWVGLGVAVVALVVGRILKALGFGQPEPSGPSSSKEES